MAHSVEHSPCSRELIGGTPLQQFNLPGLAQTERGI